MKRNREVEKASQDLKYLQFILSQRRWITRLYLLPSVYSVEEVCESLQRLDHRDIENSNKHVNIQCMDMNIYSCTCAKSCIQMSCIRTLCPYSKGLMYRERTPHPRRSFSSFRVLMLVLQLVTPVWVRPTRPSVPIGPLRPRVHLASSSVSIELSPMTATTNSLDVPAIFFFWKIQSNTEQKRKKKSSERNNLSST